MIFNYAQTAAVAVAATLHKAPFLISSMYIENYSACTVYFSVYYRRPLSTNVRNYLQQLFMSSTFAADWSIAASYKVALA